MVAVHDRLGNVNFEHAMWANELTFYLNELTLYGKFIRDKKRGLSSEKIPEVLNEAASQVKAQMKNANDLLQLINKHMGKIEKLAQANGELSRMLDSNHPQVRLQMAVFRKDYVMWKESFHQLLQSQSGRKNI
jgi:hypothetical protein